MRHYTAILCGLAALLIQSASIAQAPDSVSFQGLLTDTLGIPVDSPGVSMTFRLYQSDGAAANWTETRSVDVVNGLFNVHLGGITTMGTLAFNKGMTLGITMDGTGIEMSPLTPLSSAAYARALPGLYTFYHEDANNKGHNVVGGAPNNIMANGVVGATIGGGGGSRFFIAPDTPAPNSAYGDFVTIGGGVSNTASAPFATVGGGDSNESSGHQATIGGGGFNTAGGNSSSILGGSNNTASGFGSTVAGGFNNTAGGVSSFAAGRASRATHRGSFVWQDSTGAPTKFLSTTADNQFLVRASGGVKFYSNAAPNLVGGVSLAPAGGAWATLSDVNAKTEFDDPYPRDVLERLSTVPIQTWRYKGQDESIRHMGPTAQDFYEAFGLGSDDKHIVTVDADGVALAAIQGLYQLVKEQQAEIKRMRIAMNNAGL